MRIAIPISGEWIAPVFDDATRLLIVDITPDRKVEHSELPSFVRPPDQRATELASLGVNVLLCDDISDRSAEFIAEKGIEIKLSVHRAVADIMSYLGEISPLMIRQPLPTM